MSVREELNSELDELTDEQIKTLLSYVKVMRNDDLPDDYDESKDGTIGMLKGPTDLASRSKEILKAEFGQRKP
ncbi:MAG: hypothetical protein H7175_21720 [Burkholderiales bacterium]|nr:hypothetical protein [Anaerolineae bacterium]